MMRINAGTYVRLNGHEEDDQYPDKPNKGSVGLVIDSDTECIGSIGNPFYTVWFKEEEQHPFYTADYTNGYWGQELEVLWDL